MATGTKTVILFLEKRKSPFSEIEKVINDFFKAYKDVACEGIKNAFSTYVKNVYKETSFEDYVSIIKNNPTEEAKNTDLYKEYKDFANEDIIKLEKEKL